MPCVPISLCTAIDCQHVHACAQLSLMAASHDLCWGTPCALLFAQLELFVEQALLRGWQSLHQPCSETAYHQGPSGPQHWTGEIIWEGDMSRGDFGRPNNGPSGIGLCHVSSSGHPCARFPKILKFCPIFSFQNCNR